MNCFTWINGVPVHVDIRWISCEECHLIFISHVFHVYFVMWIIGVSAHLDIRWISCEKCHLMLFLMFSTCIFHLDYWFKYARVYLVDIM